MKRYMAILGFVFVGVLAGLLVRGIPVVLHVNAGGELPRGSRNGDVNGDASLDMTDAIYILRHLFSGGPEPVALAQGEPELLQAINQTNQLLAEIANPCSERPDRYTTNGDGTVTDECSGLMWFRDSNWTRRLTWEQAVEFCENLEWAGFDDWRLPTALELKTIEHASFSSGLSPPFEPIPSSWTSDEILESDPERGGRVWYKEFGISGAVVRTFGTIFKAASLKFLPVRTHR